MHKVLQLDFLCCGQIWREITWLVIDRIDKVNTVCTASPLRTCVNNYVDIKWSEWDIVILC